jgi:alpha-glucosidase
MRSCAALLLVVTLPASATGWRGASFGAPAAEDGALVFRGEAAFASVTAVGPSVLRVRFVPRPSPGRDHSYAVVCRDLGEAGARATVGVTESVLETRALRVTVRHAPFALAVATRDGRGLDQDDPGLATAWAGSRVRVWKRLRPDEHVYGLGEKTGRLDKRGNNLGGSAVAMWNTDTFAYDAGTDPVYASVPFYMVLRDGRAHGVFLDNSFRTFFDIGKESQDLLSFGAEDGELDYYFIDGPDPKDVIRRYTALTGRTPLPPLWALGYHQSRYSYYPEARVREIAAGFRRKRIPADTLWLDIHYLDGWAPFTWDRERFPDPRRMLGDLRAQGFRTVTIVDPHPKKEPGHAPYDGGLRGDHFVKNPDGTVYEGPVWPSHAERNPRPSVFPDFSKPAARDWWGGLHASLLDDGVAGIWNDMNEPAVFVKPGHTMPSDLVHDNEGERSTHREIHNVYGMLMTRATFEGLSRLRPNERPFVLTRASFAGGQRYAAIWPGDNVSDWSQLRASIPILLGLGLSGFPFVGSDIGGFAEAPSAELFTRWLQLGVFYPFMRTHTAIGTPDQEPWSYGPVHEAVNRRAIELRYELLPTVYDAMREAADSGVPALRPLFLEFPADPETWSRDDAAMFGRDLLVAPVLREAVTRRDVYLPAGGRWFDFWTGREHAGGQTLPVPVTLESVPIFVREGAFVFRQPVIQHTGERLGQPLLVDVYPASESVATHYEDDGESLAYREGAFLKRRFRQVKDAGGVRIEVTAEGSWRPGPRELRMRVRLDGPLARVLADGKPVAHEVRDGYVSFAVPDGFGPLRIAIESLQSR